MTWVLVLAVPAYFIQTLIHEASHAAVAVWQNMTIESFKVWPHFAVKNGKKQFYFGRVVYGKGKDYVEVGSERTTRAWAPIYTGISLWLVMLSLVNQMTVELWYHWAGVVYLAAVTIDLLNNLFKPLWRKRRGDFNKGALALGWPRWLIVVVGPLVGACILSGTALVLWKTLAV
jgi:hypothetical protein